MEKQRTALVSAGGVVMCGAHQHNEETCVDPQDDPVLNGDAFRPTRRHVLGAAGSLAGVLAANFLPLGRGSATVGSAALSPAQLIRTAMHVHGSWDEGRGSWESQFAQAAALGVRVVYMSTHDYRAEAYNYLTSLVGVTFDPPIKTGSLAAFAATNNNGTVRVMAESGDANPASYTAPMKALPLAANRLRTSIAGQVLTVAFVNVRIDQNALYEIVVTLSNHPAYGNHRAGQYSMRYQFGGSGPTTRYLDASGLVGIVRRATPTAGQRFSLDLTNDVSLLWPDLVAIDNTFFGLAWAATSPARGAVADVSVTMSFSRSMNSPASLTSLHQQVISAYSGRHPGLIAYPTEEVSRFDPLHMIPFGVPQMWTDQSTITKATLHEAYTRIADSVHAQNGLISMNHPFGVNDGPPLSQAQMEAARAATYTSLNAVNIDHTDILEVGYTIRGGVDTATHLALLDTFVRNGYFLTGTGVNDDHGGVHWRGLTDGFVTGLWAVSPSQPDLVTALGGGRAFTYHPQRWAGAQLDTVLEDGTRMGQASLSTQLGRTLSVYAPGLASTANVQVVLGPVDLGGNQPGSAVVANLEGSQFTGSGVVDVPLDISGPCFVRVQAVLSSGLVAGISNPTWMFPTTPPVQVPDARTSAGV